ncbi:MAG: glycosyltransferase family 4 protein [Gemmatimonadaceae bacterium]
MRSAARSSLPEPAPPAGRPLRVLYCTDTYPPQVNGVSVVAALSIAGLQQRGWACEVIGPRYPDALPDPFTSPRELADVPYHAIPSAPFPPYPDIRLAAPAAWRVLRAAREFAPDLIHCQTEFMIGRIGQWVARRLGVPLVTSYHTDFSRYAVSYGVPRLRPLIASYIGRFHRRAHRSYTPSEPAAGDLRAMGVPRVEVWGRGVDTRTFSPARRRIPRRHSAAPLRLVHVGRLAAEKGVERILEAFAIARRELGDGGITLVIAGTGPMEGELKRRAAPGITFLGHLDRDRELPALYADSDAFVFASHTETLGLVVLEAMSSGLPVIAAPAGGVADHLRHEVNGLAYPVGDTRAMAAAMLRLVGDPRLRDTLAVGARRTAEALDWELELDRLDASYRAVIAEAAERRAAEPPRVTMA